VRGCLLWLWMPWRHGVCDSAHGVLANSVDGHLKFWKKMKKGVEFVKHYKAHLGKFAGVAVSKDGLRLCTTSDDKVR